MDDGDHHVLEADFVCFAAIHLGFVRIIFDYHSDVDMTYVFNRVLARDTCIKVIGLRL